MARVFIKTYGCSLNLADAEAMAGILEKSNHAVGCLEDEADVVVINSCVVKGHSQAQLMTYLNRLKSLGKKVVVAGCGPQAMPGCFEGHSVIGTHQLGRIADAVEQTLSGGALVALQREGPPRLGLPKVRKNPVIDIIPINKGCLGACTFCIVKKTRGSLESYPVRDIVEAIEAGVQQGIKEVWLTSPDTAVYGVDIRFPLPQLLRRICQIEGDFQVRLGMGNPNWFVRYLDELPGIFSHPKMFRFFHVPVQAGNDRVLEAMKRGYRAADVVKIVAHMRKHLPDMSISTDIIVGFPGETHQEFLDTVAVIEKTRPEVLNLSRFTPRPGTLAQTMAGQVPGKVKKERSAVLARIHEGIALEQNRRWVGWRGRILVDEHGRGCSVIGRNYCYKPVVLEGSFPLGSALDVEITSAFAHFLAAQVLR